MRALLTLLIAIACCDAAANDYLYSNDSAEVKIGRADGVLDVEVDGDFLFFKTDINELLFTTAYLFQSSVPYTPAEEMNELLFDAMYGNYPDVRIVSDLRVYTQFENKMLSGSLYQTEYSDSQTEFCDLNYVHAIGNMYYLTITFTTTARQCGENFEDLFRVVSSIYEQIQLNGE